MPFIATMRPEVIAASAASSAPGPNTASVATAVCQISCGPHVGQALGWAWKRRSPGSSYSARHREHIAKPAIVVAGRS